MHCLDVGSQGTVTFADITTYKSYYINRVDILTSYSALEEQQIMLNREESIKYISDRLAILELSVRNRNLLNLFDINIISEDFFCGFINIVFDCHVENLNLQEDNFPGVDLGDKSKKVAFQITSTTDREKVQKSIDKLIRSSYIDFFERIKFIFLKSKKNYRKTFSTGNKINFDHSKDIFDIEDLILKINSLNTKKLRKLKNYLDQEFFPSYIDEKIFFQTDKDALRKYREIFDRPALQDSIYNESSFDGFERALRDLIEFMKTGKSGDKFIAKSYPKFEDDMISDELEEIYHHIRNLRQLYNSHVNLGDVEPSKNRIDHDESIIERFDNHKDKVINMLNSIFQREGLSTIRGVSTP